MQITCYGISTLVNAPQQVFEVATCYGGPSYTIWQTIKVTMGGGVESKCDFAHANLPRL